MMKLNTKHGRYMIATAAVWLVSVFILGGGYCLFYLPQKVKLVQVTNQCAESRKELQEAQLAAKDQVKEKQKQRHEEIAQLISRFSTQQDTATELVFEIGRIANELRLLGFSNKNDVRQNYSTVGQSKLVSEAWLDVDFQADFKKFAEFINRLESHDPIVFVEEIAFRRSPEPGKGHKVSLELSFLTEANIKDKEVASATH